MNRRQKKHYRKQPERTAPAPEAGKTVGKSGRPPGMDKLIDEIDGILEENAEEFMKNYIQINGE